ncbi:MAG: OmpH family outer membrane protein [Verrucomicrobiota bacterium]|nr:OmpH family outer membrane protein [Verrucomicrobiota bacterium]
MKNLLLLAAAAVCVSNAAAATPAPSPAKSSGGNEQGTAGRDPGFGFVNLEELLKSNPQAKSGEARIEEEKASITKEYQERIATFRKLEGELGELDRRIAALRADDLARAGLTKERAERVAVLQTKEREINQFREQREQEVAQKSNAMHDPIVADIKGAMNRLGSSVNLVFDFNGKTLSGVPFVVLHPIGAEITTRIAAALAGKDPGTVNSMRAVKVAIVDMNKVFIQLHRTKEAEGKLNAARAAAQAENERRANEYKEELGKVESLSGSAKEEQAAKARKLEADLNDFRTKKNAELQAEMVNFGQPILADMAVGLGKMAGEKVGMVFDASGTGISGVPMLVWSRDLPDLTSDLVALLNENKSPAGKTAGVVSTNLRFGVVDFERIYKATPQGKQAEAEIQQAAQQANAESANADAQARAEKQGRLQVLVRDRRLAVVTKITGFVNEIAGPARFNAILDVSARNITRTPAILLARDIPDLTDEVIAKANANP